MRIMYDGTDFFGWQRQPHGRTVQEELEKMLSRLCGNLPVNVVGAGRTDSGVHAGGQVAHADLITRYDDAGLLHALNRMSPADLAVTALRAAPADFHARYKAWSRSYRYTIITRPDPFLARYCWRFDGALDLQLLEETAALLLGKHDFTALSKHNPDTPNMICHITRSEWKAREGGAEYHVTADRFLYGMVRLLVGVQMDVARARRPMEDIVRLLDSRDRALQSTSAPAAGLSLVGVGYPPQFDPWRGDRPRTTDSGL